MNTILFILYSFCIHFVPCSRRPSIGSVGHVVNEYNLVQSVFISYSFCVFVVDVVNEYNLVHYVFMLYSFCSMFT